jgi:hypothetical protein
MNHNCQRVSRQNGKNRHVSRNTLTPSRQRLGIPCSKGKTASKLDPAGIRPAVSVPAAVIPEKRQGGFFASVKKLLGYKLW